MTVKRLQRDGVLDGVTSEHFEIIEWEQLRCGQRLLTRPGHGHNARRETCSRHLERATCRAWLEMVHTEASQGTTGSLPRSRNLRGRNEQCQPDFNLNLKSSSN